MRIAIVTETFLPQVDGVVTRVTATIKWLKEQGHTLLIIAPEGVNEFEGIQVKGIPARSFFIYKHRKVALPNPKVGQLLDEFQPDVVHVVNPALLGMAGIFYGRKWPLIASWHTNIPQYADYYKVPYLKPILWWILRTLHNRADVNLCTSNSVQKELTERGFKNVHLWKRGVDLNKFGVQYRDDDVRYRLSEGETDKTLLLYVGRLAAEKEIEKIRDVLDGSNHFRLAIVGDGPHRRILESYFQGTPTVFTGFLHGEELAKAYASSDIFVFPSRTETLGLVILEAMASGLPIVVANSGPTAEQVTDGENGMLYDPKIKDDFKNTVLKLQDGTLRQKMGYQASETSHAFSWSAPSNQLLSFFNDLKGSDKKSKMSLFKTLYVKKRES
ncbi:glycosyltransferase family 4 protein [Alteribacillus bidgolensis]|uniref:Glycosyltransferase involved in cell wall bisynthesis n=1 Tax=Alteribacillus bidgolensis TaxID=930129 RepID=A0A1G8CVG1_9BACI|nr:glycosyltransferase family 1 protein [Alteribacillus bidgolensis]SDH48950.1 Glycosyltransferase involved in cell wall bisynthesis [Alteribacillus bidgolensis]